jgi:hypothetical protein|tara:strand:- start:524 stop:673 length:150 start_codon:yes stop_codon:yes gene_type:complete
MMIRSKIEKDLILRLTEDESAGKNANPNTDTSFDMLRMSFLNVLKEAVR